VLVIFEMGSLVYAQAGLDSSHGAGVAGVHLHTWMVDWDGDGVSGTFLSGLASNLHPPNVHVLSS
jgi:hypothetical protein